MHLSRSWVFVFLVCSAKRVTYPSGEERKLLQLEQRIETVEEKVETVVENLQELQGHPKEKRVSNENHVKGRSVAKLCGELAQKYNSLNSQEEKMGFLLDSGSLGSFPSSTPQESEQNKRVDELFWRATRNPCQGAGCTDSGSSGSCHSQKYHFVFWARAVCVQLHKDESLWTVLDCIEAGIRLLFAEDDTARAKDWALAPRNKDRLVLWTRLSPEQRQSVLPKIPGGFMLSETLLGAVAQLPGVDDFEACDWDSQRDLWASNSASLVTELKAGKPVILVSGLDLLAEGRRPFGQTVAFKLELPTLGQNFNHVPVLTVVNVHPGTQVDHLCAAARGALGVNEAKLQLRKANCHITRSFESCVQRTTVFSAGDFKNVMSQGSVLLRLLNNGLTFNGEMAKTLPQCPASDRETALVEACVQAGMTVESRLLSDSMKRAWNAQDSARLKLLRQAGAEVPVADAGEDLAIACRRGDMNSVERLLAAGAPANGHGRKWKADRPLHLASLSGGGGGKRGPEKDYWKYALITRLLIDASAEVDPQNKDAKTPLWNAVNYGNAEAAKVLLGAKANPRFTIDNKELLHIAAARPDPFMVEALINGKAEVNAMNKDDKTPLFEAAWHGHEQVVKRLLEAKASINLRCNKGFHGGLTALGAAMWKNRHQAGVQVGVWDRFEATTFIRRTRTQYSAGDAKAASSCCESRNRGLEPGRIAMPSMPSMPSMPFLSLASKASCGLVPGMVKPSGGDQPPSDDEAEPQSQVSTSIASASHPSLTSLEVSRFGAADLGQGVWWMCLPNETADPTAIESSMLPETVAASNELDAMEALKKCAEHGSGESRNASLYAIYPEEMEELGKLKWDGDGHYVLDPFRGDHPPTLGQIISCLKMMDAALAQSKTVLLVTSQKRRAVTATLAGAVLVLARGFSPEEAWEHIVPVYGTPDKDPKVSWDRFPPPFSRSGETGPSSLTVIDCLQGLAVALQKNWLEDYRVFDVAAWKFFREKFDASWLIPGEILAMANPWGTSQNPRFPGLLERGPRFVSQRSTTSLYWPEGTQGDNKAGAFVRELRCGMSKIPSGVSSQGGLESLGHFHSLPEFNTEELTKGGIAFEDDSGADAEICDPKNAQQAAEMAGSWKLPFSRSEEYARLQDDSFVSLLLRNHVYEVARLNYDFECPDQKGYEKAFYVLDLVPPHHLMILDRPSWRMGCA
eukprot:symbB.v1.2.030056.t1/scaffold3347.1/size58713/3